MASIVELPVEDGEQSHGPFSSHTLLALLIFYVVLSVLLVVSFVVCSNKSHFIYFVRIIYQCIYDETVNICFFFYVQTK